jgi:radical SAM protein with 4Fe4S-binding SPASM domain
MRPAIERLIRQAFALGIGINLTTNAFFIDTGWLSLFEECSVVLNISLLGFSEALYSLLACRKNARDRVFQSIALVDGRYPFGLSTNFLKPTVAELDRLIDFVNSLHTCGAWVWRNPTPVGRLTQNTNLCLDSRRFFSLFHSNRHRIRKRVYFDAPFSYVAFDASLPQSDLDSIYVGCNGGIRKIGVMPDGNVLPCFLYRREMTMSMGNIVTSVNWDSSRIGQHVLSCPDRSCKFSQVCTGCPAYALLTGSGFDNRCPKKEIGSCPSTIYPGTSSS